MNSSLFLALKTKFKQALNIRMQLLHYKKSLYYYTIFGFYTAKCN